MVFESQETMDQVLAPGTADNHTIDGRKVNMKKAVPHAEHQVRQFCGKGGGGVTNTRTLYFFSPKGASAS